MPRTRQRNRPAADSHMVAPLTAKSKPPTTNKAGPKALGRTASRSVVSGQEDGIVGFGWSRRILNGPNSTRYAGLLGISGNARTSIGPISPAPSQFPAHKLKHRIEIGRA